MSIRNLEMGSKEFIWVRVSSLNTEPIDENSIKVAAIPHGGQPAAGDWVTPTMTEQLSEAIVRCGLLFTAASKGTDRFGRWSVWVQLTNSPESIVLHAGIFRVGDTQ